jgi:environmental stress-induced protein Ves
MAEIPTQLLVFRLLVAAVAILGPTVLFFGLLRFLEFLKDDALVDTLARQGVVEQPRPAPVDFLGELPGGAENRCDQCGTQNIPTASHCRNCSERLE